MPIYKIIAKEIKTWSSEIIADNSDEALDKAFDIDINEWELVDVVIQDESINQIN